MKKLFSLLLLISVIAQARALLISEVMSNPTGDDSGREWIEIYNNTDSSVDLSTLTISIKGGTALVATPLSGGTTLASGGYAIVGSTVSGATKFTQDYSTYSGPLFKSSISLVNTGATSIDIKVNGSVADSLPSYTAAKEGSTLSLVNGSFVQSNPTPGSANEAIAAGSDSSQTNTASATTTTNNNQITIQQQSAPSPDIVLYMPFEKTVVAGAESIFSTSGTSRSGSKIDGLVCTWAFGDGGQGTGTSTSYKYVYPGHYIAQVEASNGIVVGIGTTKVRVVPPDLSITKVESGKYGTYVDISNPNAYDLDLSQWKLSFDGASFPFPKNTILPGGAATRFSGLAMGFASTTITSGTVVKILFPNLEDVAMYAVPNSIQGLVAGTSTSVIPKLVPLKTVLKLSVATFHGTTTLIASTTASKNISIKTKDTRIVSWFRSVFGK